MQGKEVQHGKLEGFPTASDTQDSVDACEC